MSEITLSSSDFDEFDTYRSLPVLSNHLTSKKLCERIFTHTNHRAFTKTAVLKNSLTNY